MFKLLKKINPKQNFPLKRLFSAEPPKQDQQEITEEELQRLMKQHLLDEEKIEKNKRIQQELEQKLQKYSPKIEGSIYEINNAQKYIKEQIRKFDWNSYVVSNYYPSKVRDAFFALNYYNIELMRIPENTKEQSLIVGKLDFWEETLNQLYENKPLQEPLSISLHEACKNNPLSKQLLLNLINARRYEADNPRLSDISQLTFLAEQVRTNMIFLNLQLLRINYKENPQLIECAQNVGRCIGILDYIKRIPYNLRKYRLYMPEDINRKYNVSVRNLWDRVTGKPKDQLFDVVLEVAAYAKQSLDDSKKFQKDLPPQAFRAFLQAVEAQQYLIDLEKVNFNVFDKSLNSNSYLQLPYQVFNTAKKQKFLYHD